MLYKETWTCTIKKWISDLTLPIAQQEIPEKIYQQRALQTQFYIDQQELIRRQKVRVDAHEDKTLWFSIEHIDES